MKSIPKREATRRVNKSINQIKKELRFIKQQQKAINTYLESETQYKKRLDWLKSQKQSQHIQKDITRTQEILDTLKPEFNIKRLQELEKFYVGIVNELEDETDRIAIMKFYLQNKTMIRTAEEMFYSIDGIKSRLDKAIRKIYLAIKEGN